MNHVRELVGEERVTFEGTGAILAAGERDVRAEGERARCVSIGERTGRCVGVDSHRAEVGTEGPLHPRARRRLERSTRAEYLRCKRGRVLASSLPSFE